MNLLLVSPEECGPGGRVTLRDHRASHIGQVLRKKPGDTLRAGIERGAKGTARVISVAPEVVEVELECTEQARVPEIELVLAVPRPKVLSRCVALVASLGTKRLHLVNAWRVDKAYLQSPRMSEASLRAACLEGCAQGGGTWVPDVVVHKRLMAFFEGLDLGPSPQRRVLAQPRAEGRIHDVHGDGPVLFAVGPEGGWIERELATFQHHGFAACELGLPVLRVEPAVAALYGQWALAGAL